MADVQGHYDITRPIDRKESNFVTYCHPMFGKMCSLFLRDLFFLGIRGASKS